MTTEGSAPAFAKDDVQQLRPAFGNRQTHLPCTAFKPVQMIGKKDRSPFNHPEEIKNAVASLKRKIRNMNFCFPGRDDLSVEIIVFLHDVMMLQYTIKYQTSADDQHGIRLTIPKLVVRILKHLYDDLFYTDEMVVSGNHFRSIAIRMLG